MDSTTDIKATHARSGRTGRRLCVLVTCFNRRELTLRCLAALEHAHQRLRNVALAGVLVDDGSTDETADAVHERFPWMHVESHKGAPLFWCRGMHRALQIAQEQGHDDYLLLNDDTMLESDALSEMLRCADMLRSSEGRPVLVVGSARDAVTGEWSYGGRRQHSIWRPVNLVPVFPGDSALPLDTFDGNVVLLSAEVLARVGNLDAFFEHAMGDTDYGLRARRCGVGVWLAPGFQGSCSNNVQDGTFHDAALSPGQRWRHMLSRKGLPWRSWAHFTRRHAGPFWPIYFAGPYVRLLVSMAAQSLRGARGAHVRSTTK